ncbi:helix-turn-helix protein [Micromonospora pisi]|uniref:Helix-turn-helix protein n=1 Tax=Micromonospora pisi TaxID=589240 RepID=A0A495JM65_9ACTN|nr:helix-turn-helix domain-containing protein [Micromonospora pisi]RKR89424.1 helix-turn-helix protein [Micromonospora pisi]
MNHRQRQHKTVTDSAPRRAEDDPYGRWPSTLDAATPRHPASFGERLREARRRTGLTQEELCLRSGLGVRTVGDLERDRISRPHRRTIDALVGALDLQGTEREAFRAAARAGRQPPTRPVPPSRAVTWSLPPDLGDFVGRGAEWNQLLAYLGDPDDDTRRASRPVVVYGPPGAGKTCFAVHAGYRLTERFPDGQIFVDLHGLDPQRRDCNEVLGLLLRNLDLPESQLPPSVEQRSAMLRALTRDRAMLFVLDNAADEAQVRPLLTDSQRSMVIVTSRRTLAGLDAGCRISVGGLDLAESMTLLGLIAGPNRVAAQRTEAAEVARLCGYLPLTLRIAGNRLAVRPQWAVGDLARRLGDDRCRLSQLVAGDLAVRPILEMSYQQLSLTAQRMFRRLSLAPGGIASVAVAAMLMESDQDQAELVLEELVDASMITSTWSTSRYQLHEPLRLLAREMLYAQEPVNVVARLAAQLAGSGFTSAVTLFHLLLFPSPDSLDQSGA